MSNLFRESLSQLSDLLEKGEKRGIFSSRMPASIERSIREENLRFMQNRDVFSEDYYSFLYEVTHTKVYILVSPEPIYYVFELLCFSSLQVPTADQ